MTERVQTRSGIPLEPIYGPADRSGAPPGPGTYPFTRGNFASGYRGKLWTLRQYSGFGTAEESNRRYRYLLDQGGTGLSVALDLPTQCGYDSDDAEYDEEVGRVGVAVDTLADAEILFDGIPLDKIVVALQRGSAAGRPDSNGRAHQRRHPELDRLAGQVAEGRADPYTAIDQLFAVPVEP